MIISSYYNLHKDAKTNVKCSSELERELVRELGLELNGYLQLRFQVVEYEQGNLGIDDFVIFRSNGVYYEPVLNNVYPSDAVLIINTNSAKLTIDITGKSKNLTTLLLIVCF